MASGVPQHRPAYGVGLAYRNGLHEAIVQRQAEIDFLEIPTEDYVVRRRRMFSDPDYALLLDALQRFPCVAHGISMSIGTVEPLDAHYLRETRSFLDRFEFDIFSEHLAYHRVDGRDLAMFLCLPWVEDSLDWLAAQYVRAREALGRPFALENVSYYFTVPHCPLDETTFLRRLTEMTDCTLLVDVTNIFNNAHNQGFDALEFIRRLPGDRVSQLHLAGGHYSGGMWQDSHSAPVMEGVWELFDAALQETAAEMVVLERDSNFTPFDAAVMGDIRRAREIFHRHRPPRPPAQRPERTANSDGGRAATVNGASAAESRPVAASDFGFDSPRFADLRHYQQATMREITDAEFRAQVRGDRARIGQSYPMSPLWRDRWAGGDPAMIDLLAMKWGWIQREAAEDEQEYRRHEWTAWVRELETGGRTARHGGTR